jgi:hypothetical protein
MATTLAQQITRANDPVFRAQVEAAFWQINPDITGEPLNKLVNDVDSTAFPLTQGMIDKRHAWATDFVRQPGFWVPRCAAILAGEPVILAIDLGSPIPDATVISRANRLVHTLAGVKNTD